MVLGNKIDLEKTRTVSFQEGKDFAKKHGFLFSEVSALTGVNVLNAFNSVTQSVYNNISTQDLIINRSGSKLGFIEEQEGYFEKLKNKICCP